MDRPVLLKRGLSATIEEWLLAAEYILAQGNGQVILCERGIRTFESATRNTLDLSAVVVLRRAHAPAGRRRPQPRHRPSQLRRPDGLGRARLRGARPARRGPPGSRRTRSPTAIRASASPSSPPSCRGCSAGARDGRRPPRDRRRGPAARRLPRSEGPRLNEASGKFVAESERVVRKLLASAAHRALAAADAAAPGTRSSRALRPGVPVFVAPQEVLDAVAGFHVHRGCLAIGERPRASALPRRRRARWSCWRI